MDLTVLEKYGVTLQNALDPNSLVTLRKSYVELVTSLETSKETVEKETDTVLASTVTEVEKNLGTVELAAFVMQEIRDLLNVAFMADPTVSFLLGDEIQSLKSELVLGERDYQLSKVKRSRPVQSASSVSEDFDTKKEEARALAEAIRAIFVLVKTSLPSTKKFAEGFPTKKSEAKDSFGEIMPDLPKLPRTPGDSGNMVGRNAKVYLMRYSWAKIIPAVLSETGEEISPVTWGEHELIPAGTFISDVAHDYVSNRSIGFVADFRTIKDAVEESGQKFSGINGPWVQNFPTGQLCGWFPEEDK